jgi:hypothetical protein
MLPALVAVGGQVWQSVRSDGDTFELAKLDVMQPELLKKQVEQLIRLCLVRRP